MRVLLDAGTGARCAGSRAGSESARQVEIFLTHTHWDHIQGLPFFAPVHDPEAAIHIHAPPHAGMPAGRLVAEQFDGARFPLRFEQLSASIRFFDVHPDQPWRQGGVVVEAFPANHPGPTVGYRVTAGRRMVAYFPDNSTENGVPPESGWRDALVDFVRGADLLIHDASYSEAEYRSRADWGHSTFEQALEIAMEAEVSTLSLFHHEPGRSDAEVDAVVERLQSLVRRRGAALRVLAAREGSTLVLGTDTVSNP